MIHPLFISTSIRWFEEDNVESYTFDNTEPSKVLNIIIVNGLPEKSTIIWDESELKAICLTDTKDDGNYATQVKLNPKFSNIPINGLFVAVTNDKSVEIPPIPILLLKSSSIILIYVFPALVPRNIGNLL